MTSLKWYHYLLIVIALYIINILATFTYFNVFEGSKNTRDSVLVYNYNSDTLVIKTKDSIINNNYEIHKIYNNYLRDSSAVSSIKSSDSLWKLGLRKANDLLYDSSGFFELEIK